MAALCAENGLQGELVWGYSHQEPAAEGRGGARLYGSHDAAVCKGKGSLDRADGTFSDCVWVWRMRQLRSPWAYSATQRHGAAASCQMPQVP